MEDAAQFDRNIRAFRRGRGWTQEVLAEKAGIHPVYLNGIERGKRNPSFKNLNSIADALGVKLAALFAEDTT
jgi:transcriptional regulator with XRE-family HTH domain